MDMAQAANAAVQATLDTNERQIMEMAYQGTAVSLNMAQAAATQQFIAQQTQSMWDATANAQSQAAVATNSAYSLNVTQTALAQAILDVQVVQTAQAVAITQQFSTDQTQIAWNAEATAQSQAATATYSAYSLNVTQTAQAQAMLYVQATETARVQATQTANSLTATPWAMLQADIVRARGVAARSALWGEFVVTPLKVILITLVVVLLIVGAALAYRRLIPVLELRLRTIARYNNKPFILVDEMLVDPAHPYLQLPERAMRQLNQPQLPGDQMTQVEIIGPSEPSIINWIAEAEQKLRSDGWI